MIEPAVEEVKRLYRQGYDFKWCVDNVAKRYGLSFEYLLSQVNKKRREKAIQKANVLRDPWWTKY